MPSRKTFTLVCEGANWSSHSNPCVLPEKAKAMMERQLGQLTNLVDQLLDVSRISRGKIAMDMKVVNLTQLLTAVVDDYRVFIESQGLVFNVKLPQGGLWVHGDSTRLTQAVGNVLHNAGKFTDVGSVDFD